MYKLPFTKKNEVRALHAVARKRAAFAASAAADDSDRLIEFAIPGLMDPTTVSITLEHVGGRLTAVVRGQILSHENTRRGDWSVERTGMSDFAELVDVPVGATDPVPKATLTVAKDSCGNIDGGVLRLEWTTAISQVPVEIRDCAPTD